MSWQLVGGYGCLSWGTLTQYKPSGYVHCSACVCHNTQ